VSGPLAGRVALVTGAGSGIGRASALLFAQEGACVVVGDVNFDAARETAAQIEARQGRALPVEVDVSRGDEVKGLIEHTVSRFGRLDCAHNNAGIEGQLALTADCSEEDWDRTMSVNLKGVWWCLKYELPQMQKQGRGVIVNTSSVAGLVGTPMAGAYTAAKHGVAGLTKTAALEYAQRGVRVNAICPGLTLTPMVARLSAEQPHVIDSVTQAVPMRRACDPKEIAAAAVWLCTDAAPYINGLVMPIDGGFVSQ
jgi:NAD(P)-dependent dehydrogenase (short-subunit alcohol dehydrogenase family)